jgi:osmotically-inducible protein OsmY
VDNVAVKRLALERLAAVPGVDGIIDRLRVKPANRMSDDGILDHLRKAYYQESAFHQLKLKERVGGQLKLVRDTPDARGELQIEVDDGVVVLNGSVRALPPNVLQACLPGGCGSRDVKWNRRERRRRTPDSNRGSGEDRFERILLDASQIRAGVRQRVVRLTGRVRTEAERDAAEWDAWYVFGVDNVLNELEVGS